MRPTSLWIRREPGELCVLRSLNAGSLWDLCLISSLRKFSKSSSVKLRHGLHVSLAYQSLNAGFMCWTLHLSFNTLTFFLVFMILTLCSSFHSEVFFESSNKEESLLSYWRYWPQCPLQLTKDNPHIHQSKQGMTSLLDWKLLKNLEFLFRVGIKEGEENLYNRDYKWLCQIWTSMEYYWFASR